MGNFDADCGARLFKFQLFTDGSTDAFVTEEWTVRSFKEAWCFIELIAQDSPDPRGLIYVSNEAGDILIVAGVAIALSAMHRCELPKCERKELSSQEFDH